ncbi:unnamed protein product [Ilex paraguariensis]|uniref:Uncharacterized protein n=1 Tax=Ilex paraguariensis TaxID=185542 RepID=A0ABC8TE39_9AQUA
MTQLRGYNVIYPPPITGGKLISRLFDVFSHLFYKPELQLGKSQLGQNTITITAMQKTIRAKHQDDTSYYTTVTMENHQVNGDVSIDKGKRVVSESDASDSEYEPDCESSELVTERGCTGVQSQEDIGQASVTEKQHRQTPIGVVEGRVPWAPLVRGRTEYKGGTEGEATGIMGVVEHGGGIDGIGGQAPIGTFEALRVPSIKAPWATSSEVPWATSSEAPQVSCGELVGSQSGRADCGSNPMLLSVRQELTVVREASIGNGHNQSTMVEEGARHGSSRVPEESSLGTFSGANFVVTERGCTGVQSQEDIGQASVTEKLHRQTPIGVVEGRVPWAPLVRGRTEYKGGTEGEATGIMGVVEHGGGTDSIGGQAPIGTFEAGAPGILELGSTSALYQGTMGNLKRVGSQSGRADCGSNPMLLSVRQELTVVREASIGTGHNQSTMVEEGARHGSSRVPEESSLGTFSGANFGKTADDLAHSMVTERGCTGVQSQEDIGQASVTEKQHRQTPIGVVEGRVPWAPLVRGRTEYKGGTEGEVLL